MADVSQLLAFGAPPLTLKHNPPLSNSSVTSTLIGILETGDCPEIKDEYDARFAGPLPSSLGL